MQYRCEAKSVTGFVQQLACAYLVHGYHNYVTGRIPESKDARAVDAKMIDRFEADRPRWARSRRKKNGQGSAHYLRYGDFFVLVATDGPQPFFGEHDESQIRNVRRSPIAFAGYSIGWHRGVDRKWHVSVRIHPDEYLSLKAFLLEVATKRDVGQMSEILAGIPFEPYAPVRRQLLNLLRAVNRARKVAGLEQVPVQALRLRRSLVKPFVDSDPTESVVKVAA
ncbi:MAG: hypothetical protein NXI31_08995 [bacterium]|nr:hypothetical protein [bacterium]